MKKIILVILLAAFTKLNAQHGTGKMFPTINGETFAGKKVTVPQDCKGKFTIIGVCFSKGAEGDLQTWLNPAYNDFMVKKDTNNGFGAAINLDVNFYFIPMLNLVNQVLEKSSKEKIKKETDKEFWEHLMFYIGGLKEYKKTFEIEDTNQPYFFVLDEEGKIVHVEKGAYSPKKLKAIEDFLE